MACYLPFSHHPSLTSTVALKTNILTITLKASDLACTSEDRMGLALPKSNVQKELSLSDLLSLSVNGYTKNKNLR